MERRSSPDAPTPPSTAGWWLFDPRRSLRARAALLLGGATLLVALAASWTTTSLYRRSVEQQLGGAFETLAFQLADKIDRTLYERYRTLVLASNLDALRRWETSATDRRRVLEAIQEGSPEFAWIGFADAKGRILAATHSQLENQEAAARPWFRGAQEHPYLGTLREIPELARDAAPASDDGSPPRFLELAVPVTSADGRFAGVLAAQLRWNWSREVQLSVVSEAAARERLATTLYHGNDVLLDSGGHGWTHAPEAPAVAEGRKLRGWLIETTSVGATFLTGFARSRGFREYRGLGWLAVVRQPVDRAFAPVQPLQRSLVAWSLVFALAVAVASWVVAGRLARRLRSVRASAIRIHEGDILAVLPRPPGESEMSHMCRALSDLVEDLRARPEKTPTDTSTSAGKK